jgi:hypothetical protein
MLWIFIVSLGILAVLDKSQLTTNGISHHSHYDKTADDSCQTKPTDRSQESTVNTL